jgi:histone deacetylase 11
MKIVYSEHFDINFGGLEKLHPFDARKYSRAWKRVLELHSLQISVTEPITDDALLQVHSQSYLDSLKSPATLAQALEIPMIAMLPYRLTEAAVLRAMRYGVAGSVLGAREALADGLVFNLSGGYHHAKPDLGEGFCLFNDIALALTSVLSETETALYIDLDAHMGNGVAHCLAEDARLKHFDMYNKTIYPFGDTRARDRIDSRHPLSASTPGNTYLEILKAELPGFIDNFSGAKLAIYNAGTDVYSGDSLGGLNLSIQDVLERDLFVLSQLYERKIPTLVLPSGGYSEESHRMIASTLQAASEQFP